MPALAALALALALAFAVALALLVRLAFGLAFVLEVDSLGWCGVEVNGCFMGSFWGCLVEASLSEGGGGGSSCCGGGAPLGAISSGGGGGVSFFSPFRSGSDCDFLLTSSSSFASAVGNDDHLLTLFRGSSAASACGAGESCVCICGNGTDATAEVLAGCVA